MKRWKRFVWDLLYPNRCGCCAELIAFDAYVCKRCQDKLQTPPEAALCGKQSDAQAYDGTVAAFVYEGTAKEGILTLKRGENLNFAWYLGQRLAALLRERQFDLIVPVPMAPQKKRERGYNQAQEIASALSETLHVPVRTDCLFHERTTTEQHALSAKERQSHVACIGGCSQNLRGKRILLCDDVMTTGSTLNRCAALLKEQGAESVMAAAGTVTLQKQDLEDSDGYRH